MSAERGMCSVSGLGWLAEGVPGRVPKRKERTKGCAHMLRMGKTGCLFPIGGGWEGSFTGG